MESRQAPACYSAADGSVSRAAAALRNGLRCGGAPRPGSGRWWFLTGVRSA